MDIQIQHKQASDHLRIWYNYTYVHFSKEVGIWGLVWIQSLLANPIKNE
jgi:hypothetical protein